jgi:hypothetical protein
LALTGSLKSTFPSVGWVVQEVALVKPAATWLTCKGTLVTAPPEPVPLVDLAIASSFAAEAVPMPPIEDSINLNVLAAAPTTVMKSLVDAGSAVFDLLSE